MKWKKVIKVTIFDWMRHREYVLEYEPETEYISMEYIRDRIDELIKPELESITGLEKDDEVSELEKYDEVSQARLEKYAKEIPLHEKYAKEIEEGRRQARRKMYGIKEAEKEKGKPG
jgi:hypothetical protein